MKFTKDELYMYGIRDVVGYEGRYAVTSCGRVYSYRSSCFLTPKLDRYGYYQVGLYDTEGKQHWYLVSRLVAIAYIPNPDNLPDVSHIDECKTHNWVNNLKWATRAENNNMPLHKQRLSDGVGKKVVCIETGKEYKSAREAAKDTGVNADSISKCCNGKNKTAGGYHWKRVS